MNSSEYLAFIFILPQVTLKYGSRDVDTRSIEEKNLYIQLFGPSTEDQLPQLENDSKTGQIYEFD